MRILFISHESSRTGAPLALLSLLQTIKATCSKMEFSVLCQENGPLIEDFEKLCPVIAIKGPHWDLQTLFTPSRIRDRLAIRFLLRKIRNQHFDLIYANTASSLLCAIILKERLQIPLLLHFHESPINLFHLHTPIRKKWIHDCDRFIAVSQLSRQALIGLGADATKLHVVFPTSAFIQRLLTESPAISPKKEKTDKTVIGFIGPLIERKGADLLAMIAKKTSDLHPDCNLEIRCIGNLHEQERQRVEYDAWRLGVADKFRHIAPTSDPVPAYQNIDILLVPSREESFSLVVPECGLLGKPVILFDGSCGVQHLLQHEQNALLVPYLDTDAVAEAIYRLSVDDKLRQTLGDQLRLTMKEHYTHNDTNSQIIQILETIEKERKP